MFQMMDFQDFNKKIRERIKYLRQKKGHTQEQMADFGINCRQYQRIESGETVNVTIANLYKIAKAFKVKVQEIVKE